MQGQTYANELGMFMVVINLAVLAAALYQLCLIIRDALKVYQRSQDAEDAPITTHGGVKEIQDSDQNSPETGFNESSPKEGSVDDKPGCPLLLGTPRRREPAGGQCHSIVCIEQTWLPQGYLKANCAQQTMIVIFTWTLACKHLNPNNHHQVSSCEACRGRAKRHLAGR